jgi:hypothetical protein
MIHKRIEPNLATGHKRKVEMLWNPAKYDGDMLEPIV